MVVFSDFQCPVCRRSADATNQIAEEFPGDVRVEFWQHPLPMHANAENAAVASLAAHRQGKFWEFHDATFRNQSTLDYASLTRNAEVVGLDMEQFQRDYGDPAAAGAREGRGRHRRSVRCAQHAGVHGERQDQRRLGELGRVPGRRRARARPSQEPRSPGRPGRARSRSGARRLRFRMRRSLRSTVSRCSAKCDPHARADPRRPEDGQEEAQAEEGLTARRLGRAGPACSRQAGTRSARRSRRRPRARAAAAASDAVATASSNRPDSAYAAASASSGKARERLVIERRAPRAGSPRLRLSAPDRRWSHGAMPSGRAPPRSPASIAIARV